MLCRVFNLILFTLASTIAAIGNRSHICRPSTYSQDVFKCVQGSECVNKENVCDGTKDCVDGSDEDFCFPRIRRQSSSCILPPYPDHGSYEVLDDPLSSARGPGDSLDTFALKISCKQGYGMSDTDSDVDSGGTLEVFCINGRWSQSMPKCVRFCKLDPDPSVRYMCTGSKICKKFVPPDSLVKPVCNSPVYYSTESLPYMRCLSGSWEFIAKCKPDCGRITPEGVQLLIDGTPAKRGELPWHVGIYRKTKPYMQICGGSLVSNNVVISAAHCFWSDIRKLLSESYFAVAIGKLYRAWDDPRDIDAQKSDVKHIAIPKLFRGAAANFQEDIAILTLTAPFIYETYIRPICLSFDVSFDRWHLQPDNLGKVAGWGLTASNGVASDYLKVINMPFINEVTCVNTLPESFTAHITGDKFCAGFTNGTALCKGDSGGGIVFAEKEQGLNRYYLRGIVSTAPTTADKQCNDRSYTTFTRITKHEDFIQNSLAVATVAGCPKNTFQCADRTCRDQETNCGQKQEYVNKFEYEMTKPILQGGSGSNVTVGSPALPFDGKRGLKARTKCAEYSQRYRDFCRSAETINNQNYITGSREINRGEFPHMVLLGFGKNSSNVQWFSGGYVISEKFILTSAHDLSSYTHEYINFAAVGILRRTDPPEYWKIYGIKKMIPHPDYKRPMKYNDIALLETETEIIFDQTVLPICLDVGTTATNKGMVTGWEFSDSEGKMSDTIKVMSMKEQTESTCNSSYPANRLLPNRYNHTTMMCYNTNDNVVLPKCQENSVSQAFDSECLYTAVGILSFGRKCEIVKPDVFTRISHYIPWIESIVW